MNEHVVCSCLAQECARCVDLVVLIYLFGASRSYTIYIPCIQMTSIHACDTYVYVIHNTRSSGASRSCTIHIPREVLVFITHRLHQTSPHPRCCYLCCRRVTVRTATASGIPADADVLLPFPELQLWLRRWRREQRQLWLMWHESSQFCP